MKGPQTLLDYEDHWVTDMGAWFPGERVVFRGQDLLHELKDTSWTALLVYGVTGRMPDEKLVKLFEGMSVLSTSYPEPRLWNNRIAALAGTTRSTTALGIGAAIAVSDAVAYGTRVGMRIFDFFLRIKENVDKGADLTELVKAEMKQYRGICGYGRPIVGRDERLEPLMSLARELGFADGPYLKLAFAVEEILLKERWDLYMNVGSMAIAIIADQGFSPRENYQTGILCFVAGMLPCYLDAYTKPEGSFFPLRCDRIQYAGKKSRRVWKK
jgi:hypothetical protein